MRSTSVRSVGAALLKRGRARAGRSIPPKECGTRSGVTQLVSAVPGEGSSVLSRSVIRTNARCATSQVRVFASGDRSEEHTSELQSRFDLVCRLLLEKKKKTKKLIIYIHKPKTQKCILVTSL